jgi:hypothetical protein
VEPSAADRERLEGFINSLPQDVEHGENPM